MDLDKIDFLFEILLTLILTYSPINLKSREKPVATA